MRSKTIIAFLVCILFLTTTASIFGRASVENIDQKQFNNFSAITVPAYGIVAHRIGKIVLGVNNNGTFGTGFANSGQDFFTGQSVPSCQYPRGATLDYLFAGAFWIGAIVGRDTLVSVAADGWSGTREFMPTYADDIPSGNIIKKSILYPDIDSLFDGAVSEEDYIMVYRDTGTEGVPADFFGRQHIPLNIEVTQKSFAWSYPYAEDFVLFDYQIRNIGFQKLDNVYMGIYVDGDVGTTGQDGGQIYIDDISGFIETYPTKFRSCDFVDTVNTAWLADNDGDPVGGSAFDQNSPTAVTGTRIIRTPADSLEVSFNWWVSNVSPNLDFGPRERAFVGKWQEEFRDYRTGGLGTPEGDVNKYYIMRNREFDYDQYTISKITSSDTLWLEPPQDRVPLWATGLDTRYLLSFGPFDINPGERLPISFAYVAGDNFHVDPQNLNNLPANPNIYRANLNFTDFAENSAWAARVYDNPGIDTDDDGYFGKIRICCDDSTLTYDTTSTDPIVVDTFYTYDKCDTLFYEGDGVPDFKGASPPPAPIVYLEPEVGSVRVRFNGLLSETTKDVFSRIVDFEGYRVYIGRDNRETSFSMVASYDRENYNKYVYNENKIPTAGFELLEKPYDIDSLRCLYGESCNDMSFNPLAYTRNSPFIHPVYSDSVFYFEPQDFNVSELGVSTDIRKVYPDEPFPSTIIPDSAQASELTEEGNLKYFEYEIVIYDLLPTVPYYVNVTAFDFGSPESGLAALETSKSLGAKMTFAHNTANNVLDRDLKVYTYPNPYRYDGNYKEEGFERIVADQSAARDRIRRINFVNLPPKCTIKIYSIDGDLIREIDHDKDPSDPTSGHDEWDLITRNTQLTVSGLYYWTVESENGETQVGKFVIIM